MKSIRIFALSAALLGGFFVPAKAQTFPGQQTNLSISAAPSSLCGIGNFATAFTCDLSHTPFAQGYTINGAATLGTPATGYVYTPNAYPNYSYMANLSGFNNSTSGNDGRTAAVDYYANILHEGQGDAAVFIANCGMATQVRAGATNFLANPACALFGGQSTAGAAGQFLQMGQFNMNDGGHDVAMSGVNLVSIRTVNTGALGAFWGAFLSQSVGSKSVDYAFGATGIHNVGVDFTTAFFQVNKSAVAIKADDKIYFNASSSNGLFATSFPVSYLSYQGANSCIGSVVNGHGNICYDTNGHARLQAQAGVPVLSACGTSPPTVIGSDIGGLVFTGSSATTSCVMTFNTPYLNNPLCLATPVGSPNSGLWVGTTTTALTFNYSSSTSVIFTYQCFAQAGG